MVVLKYAALVAVASLMQAQGARAASLFAYNVVTVKDLTMNGGDIHGTTMVGGNLSVSNASMFGADTAGSGTKLSVVGSVTGGSGTVKFPGSGGSAVYGGTASTGVFEQSSQGSHGTVSLGTLATEMKTDSSYYSSLSSNSVFTNGLFSATPTTIAGFGSAAVFNITAASLFQQNENLSLAVTGSPSTIIINVDGGVGGNLSTAGGQNFSGNWSSYASEIVWNFYDATGMITLANSIGWTGSILAPTANVVQTGNAINGGVYASSLNIQNGGEVHSVGDLYTGLTPPSGGGTALTVALAPVPDAAYSGGLMMLGLGVWQLRRGRVAA